MEFSQFSTSLSRKFVMRPKYQYSKFETEITWKMWKRHQNLPTNGDTILVQTMCPSSNSVPADCSVTVKMKKARRETQTLSPCRSPPPLRRKESALAVVRQSQNFRPAAAPLPGGAGRPKFNQLHLHLQTQFSENRCTQFRFIVVTDTHTRTHINKHKHTNSHKPTDRTDYNILRR